GRFSDKDVSKITKKSDDIDYHQIQHSERIEKDHTVPRDSTAPRSIGSNYEMEKLSEARSILLKYSSKENAKRFDSMIQRRNERKKREETQGRGREERSIVSRNYDRVSSTQSVTTTPSTIQTRPIWESRSSGIISEETSVHGRISAPIKGRTQTTYETIQPGPRSGSTTVEVEPVPSVSTVATLKTPVSGVKRGMIGRERERDKKRNTEVSHKNNNNGGYRAAKNRINHENSDTALESSEITQRVDISKEEHGRGPSPRSGAKLPPSSSSHSIVASRHQGIRTPRTVSTAPSRTPNGKISANSRVSQRKPWQRPRSASVGGISKPKDVDHVPTDIHHRPAISRTPSFSRTPSVSRAPCVDKTVPKNGNLSEAIPSSKRSRPASAGSVMMPRSSSVGSSRNSRTNLRQDQYRSTWDKTFSTPSSGFGTRRAERVPSTDTRSRSSARRTDFRKTERSVKERDIKDDKDTSSASTNIKKVDPLEARKAAARRAREFRKKQEMEELKRKQIAEEEEEKEREKHHSNGQVRDAVAAAESRAKEALREKHRQRLEAQRARLDRDRRVRKVSSEARILAISMARKKPNHPSPRGDESTPSCFQTGVRSSRSTPSFGSTATSSQHQMHIRQQHRHLRPEPIYGADIAPHLTPHDQSHPLASPFNTSSESHSSSSQSPSESQQRSIPKLDEKEAVQKAKDRHREYMKKLRQKQKEEEWKANEKWRKRDKMLQESRKKREERRKSLSSVKIAPKQHSLPLDSTEEISLYHKRTTGTPSSTPSSIGNRISKDTNVKIGSRDETSMRRPSSASSSASTSKIPPWRRNQHYSEDVDSIRAPIRSEKHSSSGYIRPDKRDRGHKSQMDHQNESEERFRRLKMAREMRFPLKKKTPSVRVSSEDADLLKAVEDIAFGDVLL
ncbi:hypothetical protein ADUPG1_006699, partial [Aduncisulcus paluster]